MKLVSRRNLKIIFLFAILYFLTTFSFGFVYNIFVLQQQRQIAFNPSDNTFAVPEPARAKALGLIAKILSLPCGPFFVPKDLPIDLPIATPLALLLNSLIWGMGGFLIYLGVKEALGQSSEIASSDLAVPSRPLSLPRRNLGVGDILGVSVLHFLLTFLSSILQLKESMDITYGKATKPIWSVLAEAFRVPVTPFFVERGYWYQASNLRLESLLITAANSFVCAVVIVSLVYAILRVIKE